MAKKRKSKDRFWKRFLVGVVAIAIVVGGAFGIYKAVEYFGEDKAAEETVDDEATETTSIEEQIAAQNF